MAELSTTNRGSTLDPVTQLYKRDGGTWNFHTGGTAFPEDQLRAMGVPRELWPYDV